MKMFHRISVLLLSAILLTSLFLAGAVSVSAEDKPQAVAVFGTPDKIDGIADAAWDGANVYNAEGNLEGSPAEVALKWRVMYDSTYLYFYAEVTDSTIGTAEQEYCEAPGDYWTKNTAQFFLDLGNEAVEGSYDANDFRFDINARDYFFCHCISAASFIKHAAVVNATGYTVEASVDLGICPGFKAKEGTKIGFDIWACDNTQLTAPGRTNAKTWTGKNDSWCNAASLGTITLGTKPANAKGYKGIIKGNYLPSLGATLTGITNAEGKDVSLIADGSKFNTENVDTFGATYTDELGVWFGLNFGGDYDVSQIIFWEGGHWWDGGWFGSSPVLQYFAEGEWHDAEFTLTPAYPGDSQAEQGFTHEPYFFNLKSATTCSGIRVVGAKNTGAGHVSCCEIEAYGFKAGTSAPGTGSNVTALAVSASVALLGAVTLCAKKKRR